MGRWKTERIREDQVFRANRTEPFVASRFMHVAVQLLLPFFNSSPWQSQNDVWQGVS